MTALPTANSADAADIARRLANAVEGEVRFDPHNRLLYATDASLYQVEPLGVVIPASVEDAVRALEFCAAHSLPILPRGGGTSLAGQCTNRAVVIDFSAHARALLSADESARTCRVEPGLTIDDLNSRLAPRGLFFAPDPATSRQANIGGCIGNNAAGARSIMYGRTSENIHALDAALVRAGPGSSPALERLALSQGAAARDERTRDLTRRVCEIVQRHAGLIRERFPRTLRRNAGYNLDLILNQMDAAGPRADADAVLNAVNLAPLLCGSEGTLAVTLGATLRLHPLPRARGLLVLAFPSLGAAIDAVLPILGTEVGPVSRPAAVELLDDLILNLAKENAEYRRYVELLPTLNGGAPAAVLYVEHFGASPDEVRAKFAAVRRLHPAAPAVELMDEASMAPMWKLRKAGEPLLHGMPGRRKPLTFIEDNAVPVERLAEFVRRLRALVESHGTRAAFWAHASVGVLHVRPLLDLRDPADEQRMHAIALAAADLARELGGVMSGEHGDGRVRSPLLERFYGPELMAAFRQVKAVFDPHNLLNPGNIVEPGPIESISQQTRLRPLDRLTDAAPADTFFDFADQHGLRGAIGMCNGAGLCRKKSGGTMCPSYMATLDERHSTRGRGNALRLAITGQFQESGVRGRRSEVRGQSSEARTQDLHPSSFILHPSPWSDPATLATLDLCLSCKACKAECPSNVDIARLKAEYLAQHHRDAGRVPLRARAIADIRALGRAASVAPALATRLARSRLSRSLLRALLGLDPRRSLPPVSAPLPRLWRRAEARDRPPGSHPSSLHPPSFIPHPSSPCVALFADCFTAYSESPLGLAARRLLTAFGYRVHLLDAGCCGRAAVSAGHLPRAVELADASLERLGPAIAGDRFAAVLFLEPSCLSAVKDDWLSLRLHTPRPQRDALAARALLVEDFLARRWDAHPRRPGFDLSGLPPRVLLHAHCHQKALWGAESSAELLRRVAGDRLAVLDAGCCGMAGAFGFTADHFDLSMRIGELSLLPAVRAAPGAAVLAPGTSCRHQVRDGAGVEALHPVQWLAGLL